MTARHDPSDEVGVGFFDALLRREQRVCSSMGDYIKSAEGNK
jgi:hypothetical protein